MAASANVETLVKLIVPACQAKPGPPVGPALGSRGVKAMDFCKEFNARTQHIIPGTPIPCRLMVRGDRTFHFDMRTPQTSWLLLNAAGVQADKRGVRKGAQNPGRESVGQVSLKHVYEIAKIKLTELRLQSVPLRSLCQAVIFQTRSMGIKVVP